MSDQVWEPPIPTDAPALGPPASIGELFRRSHFFAITRMRIRSLANHVEHVRKDALTRTMVVIFGLLNVFGLGFAVSYKSFGFIEKFEAFGVALNARMISLLFFALLILVVLSTMIVAYTTVFLAGETAFFFQHPLRPRSILLAKLSEAIAFSSWATLFLGYPVLVAFGVLRDAPLIYYLEAGIILVLFLTFAGLTGSCLALLLAPLIRRLTAQQIIAFGLVGFTTICYLFVTSFNFGDYTGKDQLLVIDRFTSGLTLLHSPYSPSHWAASGVLAAVTGNQSETLFQGAVLLANTLIFLPPLAWYGSRHYGTQWLASHTMVRRRKKKRSRTAAGAEHLIEGATTGRWTGYLRRRLIGVNRLQALMLKDVFIFVRDPAQLSQSILFLLLMAIYSVSLLRIPEAFVTKDMQKIIFFANLTAVCMILSSFTSRFLFPLISLEGRAFWIVGLAPVKRSFLIYQKALFGLVITLGLGLPMTIVSNMSLSFPPDLLFSAIYIVFLAGTCLTALATGLGGAYPNFDEDNPARIAVGMGGTLNFFASALSVALILGVEAAPHLLADGPPHLSHLLVSHGTALLFTVLLCYTCFHAGARNLERTEF